MKSGDALPEVESTCISSADNDSNSKLPSRSESEHGHLPDRHAGDDSKAEAGVLVEPLPSKDEPAPRTKLQTAIVVTSLCTALFLAAIDVSIITTVIPTISESFQSSTGYIWVGSAYLLANAACAPVWGKISDIWGRKPILLVAIGVFWVGSLLCGVSINMGMLIGARAIQGIGGGGIIVLINICISDLFSVRDRGFYFGLVGVVWAIASALGPVIGGIFASKVTWRWCFYINLPISGVGMILLFFVLKLHNPRTSVVKGLKAVDWLGSLTIVGGTVMWLFGLEFGGSSYPWSSPTTICLIVFGIVTMAIFLLIEARYAKYPIVPLHLFVNISNAASFLTSFCQAFIFISGTYWLPLYFQSVLSVSPLLSGVYLLPYVLVLSVVSALAGFIIRKTENYTYLISGGMVASIVGFGLFIDLPSTADFAKIVLYQIVAGIGVGPNFQSPLIALHTSVEPEDIASATATFGFIRQMANAISIVIGGVVFGNEMNKQRPEIERLLGSDMAEMLSGTNAISNVEAVAKLDGATGEIARGFILKGLRTMFIVYVAFAGLGLISSLLIKQQSLSKDHKEHRTGLDTLKSRAKTREKSATDQV